MTSLCLVPLRRRRRLCTTLLHLLRLLLHLLLLHLPNDPRKICGLIPVVIYFMIFDTGHSVVHGIRHIVASS